MLDPSKHFVAHMCNDGKKVWFNYYLFKEDCTADGSKPCQYCSGKCMTARELPLDIFKKRYPGETIQKAIR